MFTALKHSFVESDEGFSIEIHWRDRIIYRRKERTLIVGGEMMIYLKERYGLSENKHGFVICLESINHWERPYDHEPIDDSTRESIVHDIKRALKFIDTVCETNRAPSIDKLNRRYRAYKNR
jgi:Immunity protein 74